VNYTQKAKHETTLRGIDHELLESKEKQTKRKKKIHEQREAQTMKIHKFKDSWSHDVICDSDAALNAEVTTKNSNAPYFHAHREWRYVTCKNCLKKRKP
jgi:regulator of sigma D